jgi:hypothetical protein
MHTEAAGIDFDEVLALGFPYHGYTSTRQFDSPIRLGLFTGHLIEHDAAEMFRSRFALTLD